MDLDQRDGGILPTDEMVPGYQGRASCARTVGATSRTVDK